MDDEEQHDGTERDGRLRGDPQHTGEPYAPLPPSPSRRPGPGP
jgi:hypothetical protein